MSTEAVTAPQGLDAFSEWINETFRLWSSQWQVWVLQSLVFFAIAIAPQLVFTVIEMVGAFAGGMSGQDNMTMSLPFQGIKAIVGLITGILSLILVPGMVLTAIKQIRGQAIAVGDLFSGMRFGWGLFVIGLAIGLGFLGCCIGIFVTTGLLYLALPLMVDRNLPVGQALSISWNTTKTNFWLYVLFAIVMGLIAGAGAIACYIGVIATMPLQYIAYAVAYERTFNQHLAASTPGIPTGYIPPPYIPAPPQADMNAPSPPQDVQDMQSPPQKESREEGDDLLS